MTPFAPDVGLFRDEYHVYTASYPPAEPVSLLSVTTALKDAIAKPGLLNWMASVTAEFAVDKAEVIADMKRASNAADTAKWVAAEARRTRDKAATTGTEIHALCDAIARGEPVTETPAERRFTDPFRTWLIETAPRIVATEQMGANLELGYAGTFDLIVEMGGKRWLIDIKTSKGVYSETAGQLAAYSKFGFLGKPGDATQYPMPVCSRFGVLHLRPGSCQLVEFRPTTATWEMFKGALAVSKWVHGESKTVISREAA